MRCRDAERALALYLDERRHGPLPADLDAHLATCPTCHDEWMVMQQVESLFARMPLAEPPPEFAAAVLARLDSVGPAPAPARPLRWRWLTRRRLLGGGLSLGLPLLVALGISLVIWGLVAYSLSILVPAWLRDPQVVNTVQAILWQAEFWTTMLFETLLAVVGALLPLMALGAVVFIFLGSLTYALTLSWGWLIGRVWWPGVVQAEG